MTEPLYAPSAPTSVGRVVMLVLGAFLVIVGGLLFLVGGALTWAHATQRDADGFFSTATERLDSTARAITADDIDLGAAPGRGDRWIDIGDLATVRIEVEAPGEAEAFVGIGPEDEVAAYLEGVSRAEIEDFETDPFEVEYQYHEGTAEPGPPAEQSFWAATGSDDDALLWDLENGNWTVVIMNADGSAGVSVDTSVAAKVDWLLPVALGLLIGGFVVLVGGALLVVFGAIGLARHAEAAPPEEELAPSDRPIRLTGRLDPPLSRWLWLVKWVLVIPHAVILAVLWLAALAVSVIAWFAIVFTGRYPRGIFDFTVGVLRWTWRVSFWFYGALGTDKYPPFSLGPEPDYPATFEVDYPAHLSRGLVWVKSWLFAIPHLIIVAILTGGDWKSASGDVPALPGLIAFLVLVAGVHLLFANRYPRGLFDFVIGLNRWVFRVLPYVLLMRDEYPPFRLDQGETEPSVVDG